ncbi:MAG: branched-chain amino acid ABC transporter permease [Planctomycetota bacterium]|nr:branched-chain amino acid ABC transporter permease [Planctomycetota bacterium]
MHLSSLRSRWIRPTPLLLGAAALWPLADAFLPAGMQVIEPLRTVFIYAILALGLNVVTGFTGLLNLGVAAFMAIGAYAFGILTCEIYPFQIGFWPALFATLGIGAFAGFLLGAPLLRLRGDYLAIVTLGFGEIVQDVLKNLDGITKGTQGINPLPGPTFLASASEESGSSFFGLTWRELGVEDSTAWYYTLWTLLVLCIIAVRHLERSRTGRAWLSVREDELASRAMGIRVDRVKLIAFSTGASLAAFAGALAASGLSSTGEPANYDFQISILAVCIVIVGGVGSVSGILVGALVMIGINSIVLSKAADWIAASGLSSSDNVLLSPSNWKFLLFGLALVLMVHLRPQGILPPSLEDEPGGDEA